MKYFTKEWYHLSQQCSYDLLLKISEKADMFSEEYYKQLYKCELAKYLRLRKSMSETTADDLYGKAIEDGAFVMIEGTEYSEEEKERIASEIKKELMEAKENYIYPIYDEEALTYEFEEGNRCTIERLKVELPLVIQQQVKDMRVLALGVATKEVKKLIRIWCRANEKQVRTIREAYRKVLQKNASTIGEVILRNFHIHDSTISHIEKNKETLKLIFDGVVDNGSQMHAICFKGYEILEQEGSLEDAIGLYHEIYPAESRNVYHMLIINKDMGHAYLTVEAKEVEFE